MQAKRQAFTLIELLTVIAIIMILAGMLFTARKYITATTGRTQTLQLMETCQNLTSEWYASGTTVVLWGQDVYYKDWLNNAWPSAAPAPYDTTTGNSLVTENAPARNGQAVGFTRDAMYSLLRISANSALVAKLPGRQLYTFNVTVSRVDPNGKAIPAHNETPILLDGWSNPMLYVPATGLRGVTVSGRQIMVTSAGIVADASYTPTSTTTPPVTPVGAQPFWASAGPDGDFTKGDDNVYSFEK